MSETFSTEQLEQLKKAIATNNVTEGKLNLQQAQEFIRLLQIPSVLLGAISTKSVTNKVGEIYKIKSAHPITRAAAEGQTVIADTFGITTSKVGYSALKTHSKWGFTTDMLENTVEGAGLEQTLYQEAADQIGRDFEQLAIAGDTSITGNTDPNDLLLKIDDGFLKLSQAAAGSIIVNAEGAVLVHGKKPGPGEITLTTVYKALPKQYLRLKANLRWLCALDVETKLFDDLQERETPYGDRIINGGDPLTPWSIPMMTIPLWPANLTANQFGDGDYTGSSGSDHTTIMLTDPKNLYVVIARDITNHQIFRPESDSWDIYTYGYTDRMISEQTMVVKLINLKLG